MHVRGFVAALSMIGLVAACGGGGYDGGGGGGGGGPLADVYVNAATGSDANVGTTLYPVKTITHGIALVAASGTIHVAPGVYDAVLGETFPLLLPAGVSLLGDEATKGNGISPTWIHGGGAVPPPNAAPGAGPLGAALVPGANCVVAGFRLDFNAPGGGFWEYAITLQNAGCTIRNNYFNGSQGGAIYCFNGVGNHVVTGNEFVNNSTGIHVLGGGAGTRVQSNVFTNNFGSGVLIASPDLPDLGGGAAGSTGGNVFSCNVGYDLGVVAMVDLFAQSNAWDHAPPTTSPTPPPAGTDIWNASGSTVHTDSNTTAVSACP